MEMIDWQEGCPVFLDQTRLPLAVEYRRGETVEQMAQAIEKLQVRGAPLIGVSAAYALALAARLNQGAADFMAAMGEHVSRGGRQRPNAGYLFWAQDRPIG